jgi:uridine kinase
MTERHNLVVAIAGGSGAGKSSLAEALAAVLGDAATTLKQDWYVRPSAGFSALPSAHHPDKVDFERLARDLAALGNGESVDLGHGASLSPRPVIVVEGELILHDPQVRDLIDQSIFLDAPPDLRLVRRLRREAREGGHDAAAVLVHYASIVRPMHDAYVEPQRALADRILDASSQHALDEAGAAVAVLIRPHLEFSRIETIARV